MDKNNTIDILMIASGFELGGVTSAMRNLCNELVKRGHRVDILNLPMVETLPAGFDKRISLLPIEGFVKYWKLSMDDVHRVHGITKVSLLILGLIKKLTNRGVLWYKIVFKSLHLQKRYDISIGFRQSTVSYWLAKYKCDSDLAVGFWHADSDFENTEQLEKSLYYPDKICCVSNAITQQMKKKHPQLSDKFVTVYNLFAVHSIKLLGNESVEEYEKDIFRIVTVSRFSPQKRIIDIAQICNTLKKNNIRFKWYIIGDGEELDNITRSIAKFDVADYMILLGAKNNPYPYIKNADLFVLTSKWESYGMVITEALILGTPVIAGEYPALQEILDDGVNGIIAENTLKDITSSIEKVISNKDLYQRLKKGAEQFNYSTDCAINQFFGLLSEN